MLDIDRSPTFAHERDWRVWYTMRYVDALAWVAVVLLVAAAHDGLTPGLLRGAAFATAMVVAVFYVGRARLHARWERRVGDPRATATAVPVRAAWLPVVAASVLKTRLLVSGAFGAFIAALTAPLAADGSVDWRLVAGMVAAFTLLDIATDAVCWRTEMRAWMRRQ